MEYRYLSEADRDAIAVRQLVQAEGDHFTHALNELAARAAGDDEEADRQALWKAAAEARHAAVLADLGPGKAEELEQRQRAAQGA